MIGTVRYGIKFPFTILNGDETYVDLNKDYNEKTISDIMHIIMTERGTKLRNPDFGTDLLKYIFEPSDDMVWDNVKDDVINSISNYLNNIILNNIEVITSDDDDNKIYLLLDYSIKRGTITENNVVRVEI